MMSGNLWIILGLLAGAFATYAVSHGFALKTQEGASPYVSSEQEVPPRTTTSSQMVQIGGGVSGSTNVVGNQSINVGGDYVQGDKITGPSIEDIKRAMREVIEEKAPTLKREFPNGFDTAVGLIEGGQIIPLGDGTGTLQIDWDSVKIVSLTSEKIVLNIGKMFDPKLNNIFTDLTIILPNSVSSRPFTIIDYMGMKIGCSVLGKRDGTVFVGFGQLS